jgi:hypothetical protein
MVLRYKQQMLVPEKKNRMSQAQIILCGNYLWNKFIIESFQN